MIPTETILAEGRVRLLYGCDVLAGLAVLPTASVDCITTSPPYWRVSHAKYGTDAAYGEEATPQEHIERLVMVGDDLARVLRPRGVWWLNYDDARVDGVFPCVVEQLLVALVAGGWHVQARVVWNKTNDRPKPGSQGALRSAWEPVFALARTREPVLDVGAVRVEHSPTTVARIDEAINRGDPAEDAWRMRGYPPAGRPISNLWPIRHAVASGHPVPFPVALAERCILLGCPPNGTVLDPFCGSGSTAIAALRAGRRCVGIDIQADYLPVAVAGIEAEWNRGR